MGAPLPGPEAPRPQGRLEDEARKVQPEEEPVDTDDEWTEPREEDGPRGSFGESSPAESPAAARTPCSRRWRRAVAQVCAEKRVVSALEPEPAWRRLRCYVALAAGGVLFSPISQTILVTSVRATCPSAGGCGLPWWWPSCWWRGLFSTIGDVARPGGLARRLEGTGVFALHDALTRGRTQWIEQATEVGAVRPAQPLLRSMALETGCALLGSMVWLRYMGTTLDCERSVRPSARYCGLAVAAGVCRGVVLTTGGQRAMLTTGCSFAEFGLEVLAEHEGARLLGFPCRLASYVGLVLYGVANFLPWGLMVVPVNRMAASWFGDDPIAEQKLMLERGLAGVRRFERGREELLRASRRAAEHLGRFELPAVGAMWKGVLLRRSVSELGRAVAAPAEAAQRLLARILERLAASRAAEFEARVLDSQGDLLKEAPLARALAPAATPIVVRRADMARSALAQVAERPAQDLLLGVTLQAVPMLTDSRWVDLVGLRVQFAGEEAVDVGGVRRDFMDCFAAALTRSEPAKLRLVEPLSLLTLGADSTWRPAACDEKGRGHLWALGRLLALAMVYRCPCPIPLSVLVFKCLLGTPLRPGDVRQLDPDFWAHRVRPLLERGGAQRRQAELDEWTMDPLVFESADGSRELRGGGRGVLVTEQNKAEYLQLLCEDFLIGPARAEMGCLVLGFHEVVPQEYLEGLDAEQLRMLVCGVAELDVAEWRRHARVEGPARMAARVAGWFFGWLESRPQEARSKMLAFTTGSSVLPSGWEGLRDQTGRPLPFRISVQGDACALPSAHTCANLLVLPPVSSAAELESRLDRVLEMSGREMLIL